MCLALTCLPGASRAEASAQYLANEGVLVVSGETKVLFDPLFREDFGIYQLLPPELEAALMAGEHPFDGVDAMFISHYHDDHFSPLDVLAYLERHADVHLFAPDQATRVLLSLAGSEVELAHRVTSLDIGYGDPAREIEIGALLIEAFHIPHSGWPDARTEVQNLAYRVTLNAEVTVLHMGDADTRTVHFQNDAELWSRRATHLAMPPYWFFMSEQGLEALKQHVRPLHAVGVHVPVQLDPQSAAALEGHDLFRQPGETRAIKGAAITPGTEAE